VLLRSGDRYDALAFQANVSEKLARQCNAGGLFFNNHSSPKPMNSAFFQYLSYTG
jgi:hypothetical protein